MLFSCSETSDGSLCLFKFENAHFSLWHLESSLVSIQSLHLVAVLISQHVERAWPLESQIHVLIAQHRDLIAVKSLDKITCLSKYLNIEDNKNCLNR